MTFKTGDKGQRYEVKFIDDGKEYIAGWTDDKNGKPFVKSINLHPVWHSPKVIDRKNITSKCSQPGNTRPDLVCPV